VRGEGVRTCTTVRNVGGRNCD